MMYLSGASGTYLHPHLASGEVGILTTPNSNYRISEGWTWAADNGCFNAATYVGDEAWFAWLGNLPHRDYCLFATAPDVVGDHAASLARSLPWLPRIRALGYSPAFVLQNGATVDTIPWESFEWAFVGGDDRFKLYESLPLIAEAQRRGKRVHVGRVNSTRRYRRFAALGVDTADGTELAFGPVNKLPKVLSWRRNHLAAQTLWRTA